MHIAELVLASSSPYRQKLLKSTGIAFRCVSSGVDETCINGSHPCETARLRAIAKAVKVGKDHPQSLVIGCDQVLSFAEENMPKAQTAGEVKEHLRLLSGKEHLLYSAYCMYYHAFEHKPFLEAEVVSATMQMRQLTEEEIVSFVDYNEWSETVGCYRYESVAVNLFSKVEGSMHTIVGLPLIPVLARLRGLGINPLLAPNPPWRMPTI